jgi:hypothetical protein
MELSDQIHTVTALVVDGPPYTLLGVGMSLAEGLNSVMQEETPVRARRCPAQSLVTIPAEQSRFY